MVKTTKLKNGVTIVSENVPYVRSCSLGIWCQSGSRHEPEALSGISHFIEHMLFKGTQTLDAAQLAEEFDAIGGGVNAFTTKEHTCYYVRTLDEYIARGAQLLCDMFFSSAFKEEDVNLERGVIIEEIGMYEDTPEEVANELLFGGIYDGYALGRSILGTRETLAKIDGKTLSHYYKENYVPSNTIVSISGSFTDENIAELSAVFGAMPDGTAPKEDNALYTPMFVTKTRDIEQNHLYMAFPALPSADDRRYIMQVLNNILGGGMSSRLFQTVREQNGLCYSVYSFAASYIGTGSFGVYVALGKNTEKQAIELICREIKKFCAEGVSQEELDRSKQQIKASVLMSLESTSTRMSNNAKNQFLYGKAITEDEIIAGFNAVTCADIKTLSNEIFDFSKVSFSAVGKVCSADEYKAMIQK